MKLEIGMTTRSKELMAQYRACLTCARHPHYPDTPPVTLHREGECQICHGKPPVRASW